jgi:hypothetical protein
MEAAWLTLRSRASSGAEVEAFLAAVGGIEISGR